MDAGRQEKKGGLMFTAWFGAVGALAGAVIGVGAGLILFDSVVLPAGAGICLGFLLVSAVLHLHSPFEHL